MRTCRLSPRVLHAVACVSFLSLASIAACGGPAPQEAVPDASAAHVPAGEGGASSGGNTAAPRSASSSKASASVPDAPPKPTFREVVVPAGTTLKVRLTTGVASDTSAVEDAVRGTLESAVKVDGDTAIPADAELTGTVTSAQRSGKVSGLASLAFRFDRLSAWDERYDVESARISREARSTKKRDATKVGIGAGAGALVGAIAGGGKGAAIGSAIGAGAGAGVVMATRGEEVRLPAGTVVTTKLDAPLTVRVPVQ
jgi:hypothetical protein